MKFVRISHSPSETQKIAQAVAKVLSPGDIVALIGRLGTGKTVFVRGLLSGRRIRAHCLSPSFLRCRRLQSGKKVFYHLDLYRTRNDEIFNREIYQNIVQEKAIAAIEWAQRSHFWQKQATVKVVLRYLPQKKFRQVDIFWLKKKNEHSGN